MSGAESFGAKAITSWDHEPFEQAATGDDVGAEKTEDFGRELTLTVCNVLKGPDFSWRVIERERARIWCR